MPALNVPPHYHWVPMYLSQDKDFLGYQGQRLIGRVRCDGRSQYGGTWAWSNAIGSDTNQYDIRQGYAVTKELAIFATEDQDRLMIASLSLPIQERNTADANFEQDQSGVPA